MNTIQKTVLASLVAVCMGAFALPAAAALAPILLGITTTEIDDVKINAAGFDLGGGGLLAGAALTPAKVAWEQGSSNATSKLTGSMYIDGQSNNCVRVELISYDADSNEIVPRVYSTEECTSDAGFYEFPITDS